ncbi:hypothetical protein SDJN03_28099, partial [Cucurbita argyrosperma subsp. sororia]
MEEDQPPPPPPPRSYTLTTSSITYAKSTTATTASPYNWFKSCTPPNPPTFSETSHSQRILLKFSPLSAQAAPENPLFLISSPLEPPRLMEPFFSTPPL